MGGMAIRHTLSCPGGQQLLASIRNMVARMRDKLRRRETRIRRYDGREEDYNWHRLTIEKSVVTPLFNTLIIELKLLAH